MSLTSRRTVIPAVVLLLGVAPMAPGAADHGERVRAAAALPGLASDLRDAGTTPDDVARALAIMAVRQVDPAVADRVMKAGWAALRAGRLRGRGSFAAAIQRQLDGGVPPAALADSLEAVLLPGARVPGEVR